MQFIALILFIAALALFWLSRRQRQASGLPGGRVIYTDTHDWGPVEEPLYDPGLGLVGRPDYLVEQDQALIPVEVKSGRIPDGPYDQHIFQLAAYCLLVERAHGKRPPYGLIHYMGNGKSARTFQVDYTPELEAALVELLSEMRSQEHRKNVPRSHDSAARCRGCGFRSVCDQVLFES
jgi:CRISPR-associated exonuclease Cas4